MSSCERCWEQSQMVEGDSVAEYHRLLTINTCTPEQQAGRDATKCPTCKRRAVHQHTHQCVACGFDPKRVTADG